MFISNVRDMNFANVYTCGETLGNYLISKGFPLLGRTEERQMKFARTSELEQVLSHLPAQLKILRKVGIING